MDTLFGWGILSLVGVLIFAVLRVLAHSWIKAAKNYDKKLSEDKVKNVGGFDHDIILSVVIDRIDDKLDGAFSFEFVETPPK